jgi:hypothetical protein
VGQLAVIRQWNCAGIDQARGCQPLPEQVRHEPRDCAESNLALSEGTTVTREVINMNDQAVYPNRQRFDYDTFPDPSATDTFAVEVTGQIVVGRKDLTTTFGVGSDDAFLLEIEGAPRIAKTFYI